jgi:hypothetical protein
MFISVVCVFVAHNSIHPNIVGCPTDSTCEQEEKATKLRECAWKQAHSETLFPAATAGEKSSFATDSAVKSY